MRPDSAQLAGPSLTRRCAVEIHFHLLAPESRKVLQDAPNSISSSGNRAVSRVWDQVVTVDQVGHGAILPNYKNRRSLKK
jgi:hypothetical protein